MTTLLGLSLGGLVACGDGSKTDDTGQVADAAEDNDGDGYDVLSDCNDADPAISPAATELCNGIDDDCDGVADNGLLLTQYPDGDGDGYGADDGEVAACDELSGFVAQGGDCADDNPAVNPGVDEGCEPEGVDDDCNGLVDAADPGLVLTTWHTDDDGDGFGDTSDFVESCAPMPGRIEEGTDCNDNDPTINPAQVEICDPDDDDEDCDGFADNDEPDGAEDSVTGYTDDDDDGYGAPAAVVGHYCDGLPSGVSDNDEDCDDADPTINPGAVEDCNDGIDNSCAGVIDDCGPLDPVSLAAADALIFGQNASDAVGSAVDAADVDGDGDLELLVGASQWDIATDRNEGRVFVLDAPLAGDYDLGAGDYTAYIQGADWGFLGASLTSMGDVDGDGFDDIAIADTHSQVMLFYGPITSNLLAADADALVLGDAASHILGSCLAGKLDATGDGIPDLVMSATGTDVPARDAGSIYLAAGPLSGTLTIGTAASSEWTGEAELDQLGYCWGCAALGDVDGDGIDDYAGGAYRNDGGGSSSGSAYIYLGGSAGGPSGTAHAVWRGSASSYAGLTIDRAGDHNGDGYADLLVGAYAYSEYTSYGGAAHLVLGDPVATPPTALASSHALIYSETSEYAGYSVSGDGDLNGDGQPDVLVGATNASEFSDGYRSNAGAVYAVLGPVSGAFSLAEARLRLEGVTSDDLSGTLVGFLEDQDADIADEIFSATANLTAPSGTKSGGVAVLYTADLL